VEDSKKKDKSSSSTPDKRVWITKGKVIPESERALLKPHAEQKKIISNFKKGLKAPNSKASPEPKNDSVASGTSLMAAPAKSRSRLSIKLSKFSRSSSLSSTKREPAAAQATAAANVDVIRKTSLPQERILATAVGSPSLPSPGAGSGGKPASAIVQPFNYSPPLKAFDASSGPHQSSTPVYKKQPVTVKRNNSYVSSMGRSSPKPHPKVLASQQRKPSDQGDSGSVVVTLV